MTIVECIRTAEDRVAWRDVTSSSTTSDRQHRRRWAIQTEFAVEVRMIP